MEPAAAGVAGEYLRDVVAPIGDEGGPVGGVVLAMIAGEGDRVRASGEQRVETGGLDAGQLFRISDEDELAVSVFDVGKDSGKVSGADHSGFVYDEHRATGQSGWLPGARVGPVEV